ncbi:MAG: superoxide dismutase [Rickettsiaceae bacterium]|nr:superoxide dismutase [Rickettsiaceae bacterium]
MAYCKYSNQDTYPFILPELPFDKEDFAPHFSAETFDYHHGKHHNAYVTNLNKLLSDNQEFSDQDLESIIQATNSSNTGIFNNAAQIWNHTFFWHSISPNGGGNPNGEILEQIKQDFGDFETFVEQFKQAAITQFGSGWAWLVYNDGKLEIIKTSNAETPITKNVQPILACDVWEHAYYIDYRNKRPDYLTAYFEHMVNWQFAAENLAKAKQ